MELVRANTADPFYVSPCGVIALRASEYMGAARGTLTSGLDSLSASGTYVADAQTYIPASSAPYNNTTILAAQAANSETLVIDFSELPLTSKVYSLLIAAKIDSIPDESYRGNETFSFADRNGAIITASGLKSTTALGRPFWSGQSFLNAAFGLISNRYSYYHMLQLANTIPIINQPTYSSEKDYNSILTIKAWQSGSPTGSIKIDSVYLFPRGNEVSQAVSLSLALAGLIEDDEDVRAEPGELDKHSNGNKWLVDKSAIFFNTTNNAGTDFRSKPYEYQKAANGNDGTLEPIAVFDGGYVYTGDAFGSVLYSSSDQTIYRFMNIINVDYTEDYVVTEDSTFTDTTEKTSDGKFFYEGDEVGNTGRRYVSGGYLTFPCGPGTSGRNIVTLVGETSALPEDMKVNHNILTNFKLELAYPNFGTDLVTVGLSESPGDVSQPINRWPNHAYPSYVSYRHPLVGVAFTYTAANTLEAKLKQEFYDDSTGTFVTGPPISNVSTNNEYIIDGPVSFLSDFTLGDVINVQFKHNWYHVWAKYWREGDDEPDDWLLEGNLAGYEFDYTPSPETYSSDWLPYPWDYDPDRTGYFRGSDHLYQYPAISVGRDATHTYDIKTNYFKLWYDPNGSPGSGYIKIVDDVSGEVICDDLEIPYGTSWIIEESDWRLWRQYYPEAEIRPIIYTWSDDGAADLQSISLRGPEGQVIYLNGEFNTLSLSHIKYRAHQDGDA